MRLCRPCGGGAVERTRAARSEAEGRPEAERNGDAASAPKPEGEREAALLDRLLAAAQGTAEMPELSAEYINKLAGWVKRLLRHHGLR